MNILFLGPPGSGKGTQAKRLAETRGLVHLSTGDIFREEIQSQSELGQRIKNYVDSGKLVPDDLVSEVVFETVRKRKGGKGFLLDGYPRTVDQAKAFDSFSDQEKIAVDAILFFDVDSKELVKRLSARRQCSKCKEVYNLVKRPPKTEGKCDLCSSGLVQRLDDSEKVIQERLAVYDAQTAPLLDLYKGREGYHRIDASEDIDRVFAEITAVIQAHESRVHQG